MGLRSVQEPNPLVGDDRQLLVDLHAVVSDIARAINENTDIHYAALTGLDGPGSGLFDYLYKPGLSGGQHARGGLTTSEDLELSANANPFAAANTGRIRPHSRLEFNESFATSSPFSNQALIRMLGVATFSNAVWQWSGFQYQAECEWTVGAGFTTAPTFDANGIFEKQTTAPDAVSIFTGFFSRSRYRSNLGSGVATAQNFVGFSAGMETLANIGAGTGGIGNLTCFDAYSEFTFGNRLLGVYAIDNYRGLFVTQPTKAAGVTIANQIAVDILSLTHGTAANLSLRSAGAQFMQHQGDAAFGVLANPNTGIDCAKDMAYRPTARTLSNGTNNDVNATDTSVLRITGPTAAFTVTGFTDGQQGKWLLARNATSQAMTIVDTSTGPASASANQIITGTGGNVVLAASISLALFWYDVSNSKWVLVVARDSAGAR